MVRAILGGRTQTRRDGFTPDNVALRENGYCRYAYAGDLLWAGETWAQPAGLDPGPTDYPTWVPLVYQNIRPVEAIRWKPSIHIPRAACRLMWGGASPCGAAERLQRRGHDRGRLDPRDGIQEAILSHSKIVATKHDGIERRIRQPLKVGRFLDPISMLVENLPEVANVATGQFIKSRARNIAFTFGSIGLDGEVHPLPVVGRLR